MLNVKMNNCGVLLSSILYFCTNSVNVRRFILLLTLIMSVVVNAQNDTKVAKRNYITKKVSDKAPKIDGVINELVWDNVEWQGDFTQYSPYEGDKPSQKTAFKILYDDNNLYVAIRAFDTKPDDIEKRLSRRDNFDGDWVAVSVDSYNDDRTGFNFYVTAAGVKADVLNTNDGDTDDSWNPVWYAKVSTDDYGWVAEIRIPFTQLRFAKSDEHVWGLEVMRRLFRKQEMSMWQLIPRDASGWVSKWGELEGIESINPKKEVEIIPYVMGSIEKREKVEGSPYETGTNMTYNAGVDGKIALTNDLTLNFTINPDFGQVEADPSEVNLSAFESFFDEKRPFFIEGSSIFSFPVTGNNGSVNMFYSRRVGRRPHYYPEIDDDEYESVPEFTRILGAFKISGKTENGWSIGIMESITNKEYVKIDSAGIESKETAEPYTNFFNIRLQKELNNGNTLVGGMVTATNRFINDEHLNFLPDAAYVGGIDFKHYWQNRNYYVMAKVASSNIYGDSTSIIDLQCAPARYYQRPDMNHRSVDSSLTQFSGTGGTIGFSKSGGGSWRYGITGWWLSPAMDINDQGYLSRADAVVQSGWISYRIYKPFSVFRMMNFNFSEWSWNDFSGRQLNIGAQISTYAQFINNWSYNMGFTWSGRDVDRSQLRGGPSLVYGPSVSGWLTVGGDERKDLSFSINGSFSEGTIEEQRSKGIYLEIAYRPFKSLVLSIEPGYDYYYDSYKYVQTIEQNAGDTYLVADLERNIFSADIRVEFSLTPDLSIQYWGQPFVFSANYNNFADVVDAGNNDINDQFYRYSDGEISLNDEEYTVDKPGQESYTFENPDFSVFEFRSNFVFRWEYIPGSAAYLVWSQGRDGDAPTGNFAFMEHISNLSAAEPANVFLLKISYRLSM